ncbi:TPA: hypothetical protein ACM4DW_005648, partial [Escherichia coli O26]
RNALQTQEISQISVLIIAAFWKYAHTGENNRIIQIKSPSGEGLKPHFCITMNMVPGASR